MKYENVKFRIHWCILYKQKAKYCIVPVLILTVISTFSSCTIARIYIGWTRHAQSIPDAMLAVDFPLEQITSLRIVFLLLKGLCRFWVDRSYVSVQSGTVKKLKERVAIPNETIFRTASLDRVLVSRLFFSYAFRVSISIPNFICIT